MSENYLKLNSISYTQRGGLVFIIEVKRGDGKWFKCEYTAVNGTNMKSINLICANRGHSMDCTAAVTAEFKSVLLPFVIMTKQFIMKNGKPRKYWNFDFCEKNLPYITDPSNYHERLHVHGKKCNGPGRYVFSQIKVEINFNSKKRIISYVV